MAGLAKRSRAPRAEVRSRIGRQCRERSQSASSEAGKLEIVPERGGYTSFEA